MKQFRSWWTVLPLSALVISACNEKKVEEVKQTAEKQLDTVVEKVTGEAPAPSVKALTPGERAAFLGIVGHLSKDSESAFTILDGKEIVKRLQGLKTWGFIRETAKAEDGVDPEEEIASNLEEVGKFVGQEVFVATGKGTSTQVGNLMKINQKVSYLQFRSIAKAFASAAASGDLESMEQSMSDNAWMQDAVKDIGKEMGLIDSVQLPPILAGVKAADAESVGVAVQGIKSAFDGMPEMAKPITFRKGGVDFQGMKIAGEDLSELMSQNREGMEQSMDAADVDKLIESLKKKDFVFAVGSLDNYILTYVGNSIEACPLADSVEDSLAASDAISFVDGYAKKKVVGFVYGDQSIAKAAIGGSLKPIAEGLRDGLAGASGFGDTRDIAALLDTVSDKETALLGMAKPDAGGGLVVLEDGVKFELFGGTDQGVIDYESSPKIGSLPSDDATFMTGSWGVRADYHKTSTELAEAALQTAYALASKVSGLDVKDNEDFAKFQQGMALFDAKFRADVVGLYSGIQTTTSGLGQETAFVVDFKGAVPPIPGIPQELADEGHSLRVSAISPVTDRSKLSDGWKKIDGSLRNVLKTVSEMSGQEIPMPQPISSEKDSLTTWSFPLPMTNEDLMPSVTVNDKWFVVSTSKKQAVDLVTAAEGEKSNRKGAWVQVNFEALRKFGSQWVDLVDKYGDKVITNESDLAEFRAKLPTIRKGLEAAKEWDKLDFYSRKEDGKLRTTLQFKLK